MSDGDATASARAVAGAERLLEVGRAQDALRLLSGAPSDADVALARAQVLLALGRPADAEQQARAGLQLRPDDAWGLLLLAHAQTGQDQGRDAARTARLLLAQHGVSVPGLLVLARAQDLQEQRDASLLSVEQAVELAPQDPQCHVALTRALLRTGDPVRAERAARTALELSPLSVDAHQALADVQTRTGRLAEAQRSLLEAARLDPAQEQVDALASVTSQLLVATALLVLVCPLATAVFDSGPAGEDLGLGVSLQLAFAGLYSVSRRVVQRTLPSAQRKALAHQRRAERRLLLLCAAVPLGLLTPCYAVLALRGTSWAVPATCAALAVLALAAAHLLAPLPSPRLLLHAGSEGLRAGRDELRPSVVRERSAAERAAATERERRARGAAPGPPVMGLRSGRYLNHLAVLLFVVLPGTLVVLPWLSLPALVAAAALDSVLTDGVWPRLADRHPRLRRAERVHLRVVDERTGARPGPGRLAWRGAVKLLLSPVEVLPAVRARCDAGTARHDRWTRTRVVQEP